MEEDKRLTDAEKRLLYTLVLLFERDGGFVTGQAVAGRIGTTPSTIRNQMQALREQGLVESKLGPNGGYRPTGRAYELLDRPASEELKWVWSDGGVETPVADRSRTGSNEVLIDRIELVDLKDASSGRILIHLPGPDHEFEAGDEIEIGPIWRLDLTVKAIVDDIDGSTVLASVDRIIVSN